MNVTIFIKAFLPCRELMDRKADIAVAAMTINFARSHLSFLSIYYIYWERAQLFFHNLFS